MPLSDLSVGSKHCQHRTRTIATGSTHTSFPPYCCESSIQPLFRIAGISEPEPGHVSIAARLVVRTCAIELSLVSTLLLGPVVLVGGEVHSCCLVLLLDRGRTSLRFLHHHPCNRNPFSVYSRKPRIVMVFPIVKAIRQNHACMQEDVSGDPIASLAPLGRLKDISFLLDLCLVECSSGVTGIATNPFGILAHWAQLD